MPHSCILAAQAADSTAKASVAEGLRARGHAASARTEGPGTGSTPEQVKPLLKMQWLLPEQILKEPRESSPGGLAQQTPREALDHLALQDSWPGGLWLHCSLLQFLQFPQQFLVCCMT